MRSPFTVAIIDDSEDDRLEIRRMLLRGSERHFKIVEADTGARGIATCQAALANGQLSAVVLDYHLPDMNATEVLFSLCDVDGHPRVPVVILTGNDMSHRTREVMRAGAQDYLAKSWMSDESLTRALENAVERWAMAAELRANRERLERAQRAANLGTWEWTPSEHSGNWGAETWRLHGVEPSDSDLTNVTWLNCVHPDDRQALADMLTDVPRNGTIQHEYRVLMPNGTTVWLEARGRAVAVPDEAKLRLLGTVQEITKRKQAENVLRRRDEQLRLALRAGATGVWEWDFQTNRVDWSEDVYVIAGLSHEQFDNTLSAFERLLHPADRERVLSTVRAAITAHEEFHAEFRLVRGDGSVRIVTNIGHIDYGPSGEPQSMIGTITDVTHQRRQTAELQRRQQELQTLADNSPDVIVRYDRDQRYVFVNAAAEQVSGIKAADFLGKSLLEVTLGAEALSTSARVSKVIESKRADAFEVTFEGPKGKRVYSSRLIPELNDAGEVEHVLCVGHDITERNAARDLLIQADRRKDEFLATLAHELRNPLAPIQSGVEFMRLTEDRDALLRTTAMMARQVKHMARLIDDLMDVSRIASGKVTLRRVRVNLRDIVAGAAENVRAAITQARHSLDVSLSGPDIWVEGDEARLTQIVGNLLNNAIKYTPEGGWIRIGLRPRGDQAVLTVQDNGLGIPADMRDQIFHMFAQVNQTLNRSQGGLGIGLALVKHLVEVQGGTIRVDSAGVGQGSTFEVQFPCAAAVEQRPISQPSPAVQTERVLVVDDNADSADMLAHLIQLIGMDVQVTYDAANALQIAKTFKPSYVLSDIGLPDMTGFELARQLRAIPETSKARLIAITGWDMQETRVECQVAGFDQHYVKPITTETLKRILTTKDIERATELRQPL